VLLMDLGSLTPRPSPVSGRIPRLPFLGKFARQCLSPNAQSPASQLYRPGFDNSITASLDYGDCLASSLRAMPNVPRVRCAKGATCWPLRRRKQGALGETVPLHGSASESVDRDTAGVRRADPSYGFLFSVPISGCEASGPPGYRDPAAPRWAAFVAAAWVFATGASNKQDKPHTEIPCPCVCNQAEQATNG
jgi:hypothetical protein